MADMLLSCPRCGYRGLSIVRKLFLGPALPARCKVCRRKVGVPYLKFLAAGIPLLAALLVFPVIQLRWAEALLGVLGFAATSLVVVYWVPLEKR